MTVRPKTTRGVAWTIVGIWTVTALVGSFGVFLPRTVRGEIQWYDNSVLRALTDPAAWMAIGVGGSAILAFFALFDRTDTMRAPLAASVTIVFFGLLLFPVWFSGSIDAEYSDKLVWAWALVISFYFAVEGGVQVKKIDEQGKAEFVGMTSTEAAERVAVPGDGGLAVETVESAQRPVAGAPAVGDTPVIS